MAYCGGARGRQRIGDVGMCEELRHQFTGDPLVGGPSDQGRCHRQYRARGDQIDRQADRRGQSSYAPNEFKDPNGKIVGFDVDLMNAIAGTLGLTPEYREETDFAKIIPAIQGGTYNVGMSSFTDSREREQQVDFVTYFSAGILWAQRAGDPIDPNNACGKKVAVAVHHRAGHRGTARQDQGLHRCR